MVPVIWQLGYPKSGNTWICFALHYLLTGQPAAEWNAPQQTIPNWDKIAFEGWPCPYGWTRGHVTAGLVATDHAEKIIYVVRHPLGVALSALRDTFRERTGIEHDDANTKGWDKLVDWYLTQWSITGAEQQYLGSWAGTWRDNVRWADDSRAIVIRYEDMHTAPHAQLRAICDHGGLEADDAAIDNAVEASDVGPMRRLDTKRQNIRQAQRDGWRIEAPAKHRHEFARMFASEYERFGYHE